jgi:multiple sugar transport system permease protein
LQTISRKRDARIAFLLVTPVILLLVLIILIPEIFAFLISLTNYRLGRPLKFVRFSNFIRLFNDQRFWFALGRNLVFVVVSVTFQMLIGLAVSLLLAKRFPFQRFWVALVIAPIAVTISVAAVMWKYLLDYNIGPINYILQQAGLGRPMWLSNSLLALPAVILVYVWRETPNVILILYPARITFPETLYEAASIDGASPWQRFRHITLPLLRPALYVALVFRIIISFRAFGVVWTLTKGGPIRASELLAIYLFREGFKYWRFGSAAAVGWVMLLVTMLAAIYQMRSMYRNMFAP